MYGLFRRLEESAETGTAKESSLALRLSQFTKAFEEAMDDDLNTPKAIAEFQQFRTDVNQLMAKGLSDADRKLVRETFRCCGEPLGLFQIPDHEWVFRSLVFGEPASSIKEDVKELTDEWIQRQIEQREQARLQKDFAAADHIRNDLATQGIILEDRPDGTTRWKR